jgi:hypothetical protein
MRKKRKEKKRKEEKRGRGRGTGANGVDGKIPFVLGGIPDSNVIPHLYQMVCIGRIPGTLHR